jgi:hypothetical protein
LRFLFDLFDWFYFAFGFELDYGCAELFDELCCESIEIVAEIFADALEGVVAEDVVGDGQEDLFYVVYEFLQFVVFGLSQFFLYFGEGGRVFRHVAEVVDAKFGDLLDLEEGFDVGFGFDVGEEAADAIVFVPAVEFHVRYNIVQNE